MMKTYPVTCDYRKTHKAPRPWALLNYLDTFETYESEFHDILGYKGYVQPYQA